MPTSTFSIALSGDDQRVSKSSSSYPPSGAVIRNTTGISVIAERYAAGTNAVVAVGLLKYDTSSLPDDAVISSAFLRLQIISKANANTLSFVAEYYAWNSTDTDYTSTPGTNAHSGTAIASVTTGVANDFPLQNLGNISLTGTTYFRLHITQRASDAAPTGDNYVEFASFDHTTLTEPQLIVTYAIGGGDLIGQVGV